jgi:antitoxin CptB
VSAEGRLRWRCRRGTKELDALLTGYLDRDYPQAMPGERAAFASLLEWPDDVLLRALLGREIPAETETARLVENLRRAAAFRP